MHRRFRRRYTSNQQQQQQQQNQGNNELLHTTSSTLCSFISATPNWTNAALIGEHLWNDTTSTETCYVDESEYDILSWIYLDLPPCTHPLPKQ
uniref:Uncharacterized protein n=1 Tax=Schistosoma haematobium TaxID=6185 RepID=A0A094ZCT9_SCHHA